MPKTCRECGEEICETCGICHGAMVDAEGDTCIDMLKAALKRGRDWARELRLDLLAAEEIIAKDRGVPFEDAYSAVQALVKSPRFRAKWARRDAKSAKEWNKVFKGRRRTRRPR